MGILEDAELRDDAETEDQAEGGILGEAQDDISRLVAPDPMERLVVPETCARPMSTTSVSSLCSPERLLVPEILNSPGSPEYRSQQLAFLSLGGAMESRAHRLSLSPG